jgi:hypothetical protein
MKKYLSIFLSVLAVFFFSSPAAKANWARAQAGTIVSGSGSSLSTQATLTGVTIGNELTVCTGSYQKSVVSVTDGFNTYTNRVTLLAGNIDCEIWTAPVTTGGNLTVTVLYGGTGAAVAPVAFDEYSYSGTLSVDSTNTGSGSGSPEGTANLTVTGKDLILNTTCFVSSFGTPTAGSGFTLEHQTNYVGGQSMALVVQDGLNVTTSPISPSMTTTSGLGWVSAALALKTPNIATGNSAALLPQM